MPSPGSGNAPKAGRPKSAEIAKAKALADTKQSKLTFSFGLAKPAAAAVPVAIAAAPAPRSPPALPPSPSSLPGLPEPPAPAKKALPLAVNLAKLGLQKVEIVGDGNCGYRVVAVFLYDDESRHTSVREDVVADLVETRTAWCCGRRCWTARRRRLPRERRRTTLSGSIRERFRPFLVWS
jgi:hypothetical protein